MVIYPIIEYPNPKAGQFILDTDASISILDISSQVQENSERVILVVYGSRVLTSERHYCVTRKEKLALVYFMKLFQHNLQGKEFILCTDHGYLTCLHRFKQFDGQICRWFRELEPFNFKIVHR